MAIKNTNISPLLKEGANITLTQSGQVITIAANDTTNAPGGSDTQVQFNDGGNFGGDAGLTYNKTTNVLGLESIDFAQTPTATSAERRILWNNDEGTAVLTLKGGNVTIPIGHEVVTLVYNAEATTLNKGEVVYAFGAQGQRVSVKRAVNTGDSTSAQTLGVVAESIASGAEGWVMVQGMVRGINTSAYVQGDAIYLGSSAGTFTNTKPYAPNHLVYVGFVVKVNASSGEIFVKCQNGYEMDELHNVSAQSPSNNDILAYNTSTNLWEKKQLSAISGITGTGTQDYVAKFTATGTTIGNSIIRVSGTDATYFSTYKGANSDGSNIFIGGGGLSSVGAVGETYKGAYNSAVGAGALYSNTTGYFNSALGVNALVNNTTGYSNSAVGLNALYYNTTGYYNSAVGVNALYYNTTGVSNSALGVDALFNNTEGNSNTALGYQAGYGTGANANTTGTNNIFIGYQSVGVSATESNRTWIGNSSTVTSWIGGNLLLGSTTTTGERLQVTGTSKFTGAATFSSSVTASSVKAVSPSSVTEQAILEGGYLQFYNAGSSSKYIKLTDDLNSIDAIGFSKSSSVATVWFPNGNVGIGTSSPSYTLDVTGTGRFTGSITAGDSSAFYSASGNVGFSLISGSDAYSFYFNDSDNSYRIYSGIGTAGDRLIMSSSGNLGLGVTPSAWASGIKSLEINYAGNGIWSSTPTQLIANSNAYYASGGWTYASNNPSAYYSQFSGGHYWYNAPSGTAGNAISFTQAMTLASTGNLLVGTTTDSGERLQVTGNVKINSGNISIAYNSASVDAFDILNSRSGGRRWFFGDGSGTTAGTFGFYDATASGLRFSIDPSGYVTINQIPNATTDTDRFLVSDSGVIKYRTGSEILSDIGAQAALTNPVTGTGSSGQVAFFNGTSSITGESNLFWDSANDRLGIGTNTPSQRLEVAGNEASTAKISSVGTIYGAGNFLNAFTNTGGNDLGFAGFIASQSNQVNRFYAGVHSPSGVNQSFIGTPDANPLAFWTNATERMRITSGGNVGIGTNNPARPLDINGTVRIADGSSIEFGGTTTAIAGTSASNALLFYTNSAERARFHSSGNLSVGNSVDSGYKLDVTGTGRFSGRLISGSAGDNGFLIPASGSSVTLPTTGLSLNTGFNVGYIYNYNNGNLSDLYYGASTHIFDGGNIGLGVTPSAWVTYKSIEVDNVGLFVGRNAGIVGSNLYYDGSSFRYINTGNYAGYYNSNQTGGHAWFISPIGTAGNVISFTQAMTLDASGRLGIGTTSPSFKLQVSGSISTASGIENVSRIDGGSTVASGGINFISYSTDYVRIAGLQSQDRDGNNRALVLNPSGGNLLVGTTTDSGEKLSVDGSGKFNGRLINTTNVYSTGDAGIAIQNGDRLGFDESGVRSWSIKATSGALNLYSGDGSGTFVVGMALQVNKDALINGITVGRGAGNISNNVVIGNQALYSNTTGDVTIAIGQYAGFANTTGYGGIYIGYNSSGSSNANFNTSIGYSSLASNVSGTANTVLGSNALYSTTGSNNVAIGADAGQTAYSSGTANTLGSNNIFIGYRSIGVSATESNRTWIGNTATETSWIGGNLLLGSTTTTGERLQVTGTSKFTGILNANAGVNIGPNALGSDRMFQVSGTSFTSGTSQFASVINPTMGTPTTLYGVYLGLNCTSATNAYSLYIDNHIGTITNNYGIYQVSSSQLNYFNGSVLIGSSSSTGEKLQVTGTAIISSTTTLSSLSGTGTRMVVADSSGVLSTQAITSGIGGSTGSTDNAILRADGTGGSTLQASSIILDDSANLILGTTSLAGGTREITVQGSSTNINAELSAKGNGDVTLSTSALASAGSGVNLYARIGQVLAYSSLLASNAVKYSLKVQSGAFSSYAAGLGVGIELSSQTGSLSYITGSTIESVSTDITSSSEDFDLLFKTMSAGAAASERFRIKSTGQLKASAYTSSSSFSGTAAGYLAFTSSGDIITTTTPASGVAGSGTVNYVPKFTSNSTTLGDSSITDDGTTVSLLQGQLKFPASINSSTNANTLDDYEEGTFTPSLSASGSTFSYNVRYGTYTKIGRACTINIYFQLNTTGNTLLGNALTITGLPFSALNVTGNGDAHVHVFWSNISQTMVNMMGIITQAQTSINMYKVTSATTSPAIMNANDLSTTGGSQLRITFTYTTA